MRSETVEKRRAIIINVVYFALILAAFYLIFKTFFGVLVPFIVAFLVAAALHRPVTFICRKTPLKRGIVSTVFVLLILSVIGFLIFLVGAEVVDRLRGFFSFVSAKLQNLSDFAEEIKTWLVSAISFLPDGMRVPAANAITDFFNNIIENGIEGLDFSSFSINWSSVLSMGAGTIKDTVVQIPSVIIAIVITIIASVFMTIDYDKILVFVKRQIPERYTQKLRDAKTVSLSTLKKMFKAYSLIVLITTTELTIGLYILKFLKIYDSDYIVIIAIIIAIIDIVPVLGTGTVLIPWAVYSFISGSVSMGIGLIILYAVILVIRQVIEPKLVAGQAGLSPIVTIMAMYIGTKLLGVLGFFILPFVCIVIKKLNDEGIIHLFKTEKGEERAVGNDVNFEKTESIPGETEI